MVDPLREMDSIDGDVSGKVITPNVNPIVDHGASGSTLREKHFDPCRKRCREVTEDGVSTECTFGSLSYRTVQLFVVASDTRASPSPDEPIKIIPEACNTVNMQEGYDHHSTQAVLEAVEINGKHTLSLAGKDVISHSSWFKEYSHPHPNPHGDPDNTVYYYECYEFPYHYIRWRDVDHGYVVDCEPKMNTPCTSEFQWRKKPIEAENGGMQFSWLLANIGNSSEVSPFYLSFQGDQPKIQQNIDSAMQFFISPAKPDSSARSC